LTSYNIQAHEIVGPADDLALHLVITDKVAGLCCFWNNRAARDTTLAISPETRSTFLLPVAEADGQILGSLCRYIRSRPAVPHATSDADLIVTCDDEVRETVRNRFKELPGVEVLDSWKPGVSRWFGHKDRVPREADPNRPLRCVFYRPHLPTTFREGFGRR